MLNKSGPRIPWVTSYATQFNPQFLHSQLYFALGRLGNWREILMMKSVHHKNFDFFL